MSRTVFTAFALAAGAAGLMACGEGVDPSSQPSIGGERFEEIRFAELWRPDESTSKETKTVDLVETETLSLEGSSPENVVKAYDKVLESQGWEQVQKPQAKRDSSWYGSWRKMGRNFVVTAHVGTPAEEGAAAPVEFTLAFQRPTKPDQVTGVDNSPIAR